ncbi:hypothetical protein PAMP_016670 [Pampus punctatissimus]
MDMERQGTSPSRVPTHSPPCRTPRNLDSSSEETMKCQRRKEEKKLPTSHHLSPELSPELSPHLNPSGRAAAGNTDLFLSAPAGLSVFITSSPTDRHTALLPVRRKLLKLTDQADLKALTSQGAITH